MSAWPDIARQDGNAILAEQVTAGLQASLLAPALAGAVLGVPAGIALVTGLSHGSTVTLPPSWQLVAVVVVTLAGITGLTAGPARAAARRPPAQVL